MRAGFSALIVTATLVAGCNGDDEKKSTPNSDAGTCAESGVNKRPWVLHVDETSALVRWEACKTESAPDLTFSPEGGGAAQTVTATVSEVAIPNTYLAPLGFQIPPDAAGTYYMREAAL